jgi:hypothetical protein
VRSLGRAGYEVALGTCDPDSSTALSRYVSDVWLYDGSSPERFQNHLEAFVRSEKPEFVFAVGETLLRRMAPVADRLEPLAVWVNPAFETVSQCLDRPTMLRLAGACGIPTDIGLPRVRRLCHVAAVDGSLVAYLQQSEAASEPPSPALRRHCEQLVERLRYTGIGCIQFVAEPHTGKIAFLEMNPHLHRGASLAHALGYDFPRLAMQLAVYRKMRDNRALNAAEAARPAPFVAPYATRNSHLLRALDDELRDPLPPLHALGRKLSDLAARRRAANARIKSRPTAR